MGPSNRGPYFSASIKWATLTFFFYDLSTHVRDNVAAIFRKKNK